MNKKADTVFTVIFYMILAGLVIFMFAGKWLADNSASAVSQNNLTGIEAFLLSNMPFIVIIVMLLGLLGWMYLGR